MLLDPKDLQEAPQEGAGEAANNETQNEANATAEEAPAENQE